MKNPMIDKCKHMILPLYLSGLAASIALLFSYPPLVYVFMAAIFIGLIAGLKYGERISNKVITLVMRCSYVWLVLILALSLAKAARPYFVL